MGREVIKVIRSNRRTISLEITTAGDVLVRAPRQEFSIILTVALLIVSILNMKNKK